ncbi:MAG: hypothetical protein SXA11_09645 [Cyanobacteriota bacterium]|nr:hypothetical protein [Cyanobacteriota bacterium]
MEIDFNIVGHYLPGNMLIPRSDRYEEQIALGDPLHPLPTKLHHPPKTHPLNPVLCRC